jgi:hypothetical protein
VSASPSPTTHTPPAHRRATNEARHGAYHDATVYHKATAGVATPGGWQRRAWHRCGCRCHARRRVRRVRRRCGSGR